MTRAGMPVAERISLSLFYCLHSVLIIVRLFTQQNLFRPRLYVRRLPIQTGFGQR